MIISFSHFINMSYNLQGLNNIEEKPSLFVQIFSSIIIGCIIGFVKSKFISKDGNATSIKNALVSAILFMIVDSICVILKI